MKGTHLGIVGDDADPLAGRAWVRTFPGGDVEVLYRGGDGPGPVEQMNQWFRDAGSDTRVTRLGPPRYGEPEPRPEQTAETNAERSARRARQRVRWLVKAMQADQMLTLTYRENVTDYEDARKHFQRFVAMCRREWPTFKYVAAPEPQKRGAWHWHIGVKGWQNYDKLRGFWWRAMGYRVTWSAEGKPVLLDVTDTPGNVQGVAAKVRGRSARSWSADRMAGYLAKYVAKNIGQDGVEGAAYSASRGLVWRTERYAVRALTYAGVCASVFDLMGAAGVHRPFVWQSACRGVVWAAGLAQAPDG